jgi:glyoxylase-like metal-dependent hydrolase (beta-lactamase superfamily II)
MDARFAPEGFLMAIVRLRLAALLFAAMATLACASSPGALAIGSEFAARAEVVKLAENVYAFVGANGDTNSAFVVTNDGVVVMDAQGPAGLAKLLLDSIREVTDRPVMYVINTHYHGDHTFGNQYFAPSSRIIAHEATRRNLVERDAEHRERFKRFFGEDSLEGFSLTLPGLTVKDGLSLRIGGEVFDIVHPGVAHTDGDLYVYMPERKILFAGDVVYNERLPLLGEGDSFKWVEAIDSILALDVVTCVPGHGKVGDAGTITGFRAYLTDLHAEVKRLRAEGLDMDAVKEKISLPRYSGHAKYSDWLGQNAGVVYQEMEQGKAIVSDEATSEN